MTQAKNQFERVARAFKKVLDNKNRDPAEYEDDVWSFIHNCWHLRDWIRNDARGVAKATRQKIDVEVSSYPALVMMGDLTNKSKALRMTNDPSRAGDGQKPGNVTGATAYIDTRAQPPKTGDTEKVLYLVVTDNNGDVFPVRKLATDAMKNWMAIIKKYRI